MKNKLGASERKVPKELAHLPRFSFTSGLPATREQAQMNDVAFGISTIGELLDEADRRFGPEEQRPLSRSFRKR